MRATMLPVLAIVALSALAAEGHAEAPPALDRKAIEQIVRDYLVGNPEVLEDALIALSAKREGERRARVTAAIGENRGALLSHPMSPVSGNLAGDVTVVEFFDYQCSYCKRSLKPVMDVLARDGQLRIVWKDLPILGPVSRFAARAAMAAEKQGRYLAFHKAVMGTSGKLSKDLVIAIAGRLGLDVERLRRDMKDPAIETYLDETNRLAKSLGIDGTPAFVIGDTLAPGVVDGVRLKQIISDVRAGG